MDQQLTADELAKYGGRPLQPSEISLTISGDAPPAAPPAAPVPPTGGRGALPPSAPPRVSRGVDAIDLSQYGGRQVEPEESDASDAWRIIASFAADMDPRPIVKAISDDASVRMTKTKEEGGYHPLTDLATSTASVLGGGLLKAHWSEFQKWYQAKEKTAPDSLAHLAAALLPVVGPAAARAGETAAQGGKIPEAIGQSLAVLVPFISKYATEAMRTKSFLPTAAKVKAAPPLSFSYKGKLPNDPELRSAVVTGQDMGVPVDYATASGRESLRQVQQVADHTVINRLLGRTDRIVERARAGLENMGRQMSETVNPGRGRQDAALAAEALRDKLVASANGAQNTGKYHYDLLRDIETQRGPILVDMKNAKVALKPILARLKQQSPQYQASMSYEIKALENIIDGPDMRPASVLDTDLSMLKSDLGSAAEGRTPAQGITAQAVAAVEAQLQKAVKAAGPDAEAALSAGRKAIREEKAIRELAKKLNAEPGKTFAALVANGDKAIKQLQLLAKAAPDQLADVARAWVDDLLEKMTSQGELARADGIWRSWENMGPNTKKILFPQSYRQLNDFFLLMKRMAKDTNPSGSGKWGSTILEVGSAASGKVIAHPVGAAMVELGSLMLSKMFHDPKSVRALTRGFSVTPGNTPAWIGATDAILNEIQRAEQTVSMNDRPEGWTPEEEQQFRQWYAKAAQAGKLDPNPDDPKHHYNYRMAFASGAWPDAQGHWPSKWKTYDHPNRFVDGVDTTREQ